MKKTVRWQLREGFGGEKLIRTVAPGLIQTSDLLSFVIIIVGLHCESCHNSQHLTIFICESCSS